MPSASLGEDKRGRQRFLCGLNASGSGGCQDRFTRAQSRLIGPIDEDPNVHVAPQTSAIGGNEKKEAILTFEARDPKLPPSKLAVSYKSDG